MFIALHGIHIACDTRLSRKQEWLGLFYRQYGLFYRQYEQKRPITGTFWFAVTPERVVLRAAPAKHTKEIYLLHCMWYTFICCHPWARCTLRAAPSACLETRVIGLFYRHYVQKRTITGTFWFAVTPECFVHFAQHRALIRRQLSVGPFYKNIFKKYIYMKEIYLLHCMWCSFVLCHTWVLCTLRAAPSACRETRVIGLFYRQYVQKRPITGTFWFAVTPECFVHFAQHRALVWRQIDDTVADD